MLLLITKKDTARCVVDWPSMALYHVHAQVVSRASGASAVAGAAYRARDTLTDERTGEEHDYRNRRDDLDGSEILTPRGSPAWAQDRAACGTRSKRPSAGRMPRSPARCAWRSRASSARRTAARSCATTRSGPLWTVGWSLILPSTAGRARTPHAHIMLTTRTLTPEGFGNKNRQWNKKEHLVSWAQGLGRPREQRPCARWPRRAHRPSDAGRAAGRGPGARRPPARRLPRSRSADPPGPRGPHRRRDEAADRADDERQRDRGRQPRARAGARRLV